jgi:2-keto-4-pentenoate hydratase
MKPNSASNRALAQEERAQAAIELIARRNQGYVDGRLPEACRPADAEAGWLIQQQVTQRLGRAVAGWKCGLPAEGRLVVAPIYAGSVHEAPEVVLPARYTGQSGQTRPIEAKFEPEIAFVMAQDLPPRAQAYTHLEVDAALLHARCALEIIASRYDNDAQVPFPEHLADGLLNAGLVLGPVVSDSDWHDFELTVLLEGSGAVRRAAHHPDGHPRAGLYWLANFLRERGLGLQAGQVVITGSLAGVISLPAGTTIVLHYGNLARLEFRLDYRRED